MRVLLTGANGQLGRCFQDRLPANWCLKALDSSALDISHNQAVMDVVGEYAPDVIVNAAAYTAVDKAESDPERAISVNTYGAENLALAAKKFQARLFHVSTDYVFDGKSEHPYKETDPVNPLGTYGKTKLAGELLVSTVLPESIIIRTAWVFSEYGNNFVKTMLRLAKEHSALGIVADQFGCPTYAGDLADSIIKMIDVDAPGGIYHYCGDEKISWAGFAEVIFDYSQELGIDRKKTVVNYITTEQYPTPAVRPAFSILDISKISCVQVEHRSWKDSLRLVMTKLKGAK